MNLAEQAARRVELGRAIGAEPRGRILTGEAEAELIVDAAPDAWSGWRAAQPVLPL